MYNISVTVIGYAPELQKTTFNTDFISLFNDVFRTDMPFHIYRGYTILSSDVTYQKKSSIDVKGNTKRPIWFLFSGMGSQWNGMGKGLLDIPIIAETVRKCHDILKPKGLDIYEILTTDDTTIFDNIVHAFVGIITIQIALVEILKALEIKPDGIIGHSVGENACAYADGCLTLEQAVLSSYARGLASIETETIKGMMAAIGKGYNQIKDSLPPNIEIACHNSPNSCTISGPAEEVNKYVKQLQNENIFAKAVNVANIAYHSKYIAPAAPNLLARLQEVIPVPIERSSKWISTSIAENDWDKPLAKYCSPEYLTNNLLNHVLFEEGCKHIPQDALVIEIAPHGLLQAILKRSLPDTCSNVSLTRRNNDDKNIENLLNAIGHLYISGCNANVNALYPAVEYPVPRETPSIAPFAVWHNQSPDAGVFNFDLHGCQTGDSITFTINDDSPNSYLKYHQINNKTVLPTSFFLYMTWWVFSINRNIPLGSQPVVFENVKVLKNIHISQLKPRTFTFNIQKGSGRFEIFECSESNEHNNTLVMTGILYQPLEDMIHQLNSNIPETTKYVINGEQFYSILKDAGYQLSAAFCALEELKYNETDYYGEIKWNENWILFLDALFKISIFSDMKNETDLLYTQEIERIEISAAQISSLEKGSTILCHKEVSTKVVTCNGLIMKNIKNQRYTETELENNNNLKLEGLRFVSHKNPRFQSISEFLTICLQIAIENMVTMVKNNNTKLHVIVKTKKNSESVQQIIKNYDTFKSTVLLYHQKDPPSVEKQSKDECFLIITDDTQGAWKIEIESLFVLLVDQKNESISADFNDAFIEITKQSFLENTYYLFKKKPSITNYIILEDDHRSNNYLSDSINKCRTFVIEKNIDSVDLSLMFSKEKKPTDARHLYIMDEEVTNASALENQINQDLPVAILQNGEWGSYKAILEKSAEIKHNMKRASDLFTDIQLESINIRYLASEDNAEIKSNKVYEYGVEYSGFDHGGKKIMGLSLINTFEPVSEPDPYLMWNVPKNWSLEDAVTVPFIYAQAFNIFTREYIFSNSILVNVGEEGLLAEACISISLAKNFSVYVTVANDDEDFIVKKKFPQINHSHIFYQNNCNYETKLLKITKGRGVGIVVNFLPGIQHISASLNCVAEFGQCFIIGDADSVETDNIGMRPFLKSISLMFIPKTISTLLKLPEINKKKLNEYVQEGIKTGIVCPFERNVQIQGIPQNIPKSPSTNYIKTVYKCFPENGLNYNANQRIRFDNNLSYIIVGGDKKNKSWFELVEWLISKGARKFFIVVDNFAIGSKMSQQMNRSLNHKNATIILNSSQKVATVQDSIQLIEEANNIGPLEAVFFVSMEFPGKKISNMDVATQYNNPNIHFISIFSGGLKECESRRHKGFPALVIHGEKTTSRKLSTVLPLIEDLLLNYDNNNSPTLYRLTVTDSKVKKPHENIRNYIPNNITTLESIGEDITDIIEFKEVTTLSPRFSYVKEITPIFVISALGSKPLQRLFSNLMYPAFCATLVNFNDSVEEIALKLYDALNRIQSKGGVTLVAETWQYPVGFELSRLLERDNRKYKLFILEGNPSIWTNQIKTLGPVDSLQFENNLITQLFSDNSNIRTENLFNSSKSLLQKINDHLSERNYLPVKVQNLTDVVNIIRNGLAIAAQYNLKDGLVKHTVIIGRHPIDDGVLNFSTTSEQFLHEEDDYYKFINSTVVSRKINDDVVNNIWYSKE